MGTNKTELDLGVRRATGSPWELIGVGSLSGAGVGDSIALRLQGAQHIMALTLRLSNTLSHALL